MFLYFLNMPANFTVQVVNSLQPGEFLIHFLVDFKKMLSGLMPPFQCFFMIFGCIFLLNNRGNTCCVCAIGIGKTTYVPEICL